MKDCHCSYQSRKCEKLYMISRVILQGRGGNGWRGVCKRQNAFCNALCEVGGGGSRVTQVTVERDMSHCYFWFEGMKMK